MYVVMLKLFFTLWFVFKYMPTAITNDVKIDVEVAYQGKQGSEADSDYVFAYRITITNHGDYTIKLLRRHWFINDLNVAKNEVEGEGVVGLQPVLEPGEEHQYVSGCLLQSEIGQMYGTYLMERQMDGKKFEVIIPKFNLIVPFKNN
jgi:ApaG protein